MGKGGKKPSKLVKQEKQEKPKKFENGGPLPSPIPEEAESGGFPAQGSTFGDDQAQTNAFWGSGAHPTPGTWHNSAHPSRAASPRSGDRKSVTNSGAPEGPSRALSWAEQSVHSSLDQKASRYPSSPYPGLAGEAGSKPVSVRFDRGDSRSGEESDLDYVSEQRRSAMGSNSDVHQQWNTSSQSQSQAEQQPPAQNNGPTFPIYATALSNPPIAPNPLPAPPNVLSRASEAAARMDKNKQGDVPPQPRTVKPLPPAAWHDWLKPGTYAPKPEPPEPPAPPAPPAPFAPPPASFAPTPGPAAVSFRPSRPPSGVASSVPKRLTTNPARGVWDLKHGKGQPTNDWAHQPRGRPHVAPEEWHQRRSSADAWATSHGQPGYDDSGLGQAGNSGGWYGNGGANGANGTKRGHERTKSAGAWGGKRNVQWEEESSTDGSEEDQDDGWGENDNSEWREDGGFGTAKTSNGWANGGWAESSAQPKVNNDWGGWEQNQGGHFANQPDRGEERRGNGESRGRAAMSPQQKSQILNSFLNGTDQNQAFVSERPLNGQAFLSGRPLNGQPFLSERPLNGQPFLSDRSLNGFPSKQTDREGKRRTLFKTGGWGTEGDSWARGGDGDEKGDDRGFHASSAKPVSAAWDVWGGSQEASRYSMPSLTLAHAYKDINTRIDPDSQSKLDDFSVTKIRFHESRGAALIPAQNAFFNHARLARDRVHWSFPPDKDERVKEALSWVQEMTYGLATFGVHKFLQHRERGALVVNADYRLPDSPKQYAVDYLAFEDLRKSMDKTLQVSVISYDPAITVIVFVFLPSKTGNSVAVWRRKLIVPNNTRLRFQKELDIALSGLKDPKSYLVYVDEMPKEKKDLPNVPKDEGQATPKKRKWWQFFKRSKS